MVKTEYKRRLPAGEGRQGPDLCNIDIREFTKSHRIRSKSYVSRHDLKVVQAERDKGLSVAHFFGEWNFNDNGSISVIPDMEWITPANMILRENMVKGTSTTPRQKYQPRKCEKCGKCWTRFVGVEARNRVIKKEYLSNEGFGGLPMEKETCWKCDDV